MNTDARRLWDESFSSLRSGPSRVWAGLPAILSFLLLGFQAVMPWMAVSFVTQDGPLRVTCSVGVATFPQGGSDWDELFKSTDEALYASKRAGRDRVTLWSPRLRTVKSA